jgi:predicted dehydrogenase
VDAERLDRVSTRTWIRAYDDLESLLANDSVDAVVVATLSGSHATVACQAMHAGKHVFIEKPLAATIHECARILETARTTGRIAQAGFCEPMGPGRRMPQTGFGNENTPATRAIVT